MPIFAAAKCRPIQSTVTHPGGTAKWLCAGHSRHLYEKMYEMITKAEHIVDITSLDSPDVIGTYGTDGTDLALAVLVLNQVAGNVGTSVIPEGNPLGPIHSYTDAMAAIDGKSVETGFARLSGVGNSILPHST